jgi:hypothetical protein
MGGFEATWRRRRLVRSMAARFGCSKGVVGWTFYRGNNRCEGQGVLTRSYLEFKPRTNDLWFGFLKGIKPNPFPVQDPLPGVESGSSAIVPGPSTCRVTPAWGSTGSERHDGRRSYPEAGELGREWAGKWTARGGGRPGLARPIGLHAEEKKTGRLLGYFGGEKEIHPKAIWGK